jgi:RNA polymerase sigma-70 factor (ECF subfamily)
MTEANRLEINNPYSAAASYAAITEAAYIERSKAGDQQAFAALIGLYQDTVYNLAFRILNNAEEADDASQEVFLKVWQAINNFRGDARFSTWLYRIVHNHCLNRLRSNKSNPKTVTVEWYSDDDSEERDVLSNIAGNEADNPSFQIEGLEQRELIWEQVDGLPAKYREIIVLYYSHELSYEEIADVLEVPVGTVKTHLYRAKALLKNRLIELNKQGIIEFQE